MKLFLNKSFVLFAMALFLAPATSFAGDVMPAGTTLEADSYVFTIEEATKLLKRVEELEAKELELSRYKELEALRVQQVDLYKLNLDYSKSQTDRYAHMVKMDQQIIDKYNRRDRLQTLENIGFLTLGAAIVVTAFIGADAITDEMSAN